MPLSSSSYFAETTTITPGPVVITVAFIGYLVAGPLGATAAAVGVFLPVALVVAIVAPKFHTVVRSPQLWAAVTGVTAAATGAIAGATFVLGRRAMIDGPTWTIFAASVAVVVLAKRVPEPLLVAAGGVLGVIVKGAVT